MAGFAPSTFGPHRSQRQPAAPTPTSSARRHFGPLRPSVPWTVTVERQFRAGRVIDRTKKNRVRLLHLSRETCEEFRTHRALMQREMLANGRPLCEFVFSTRRGAPIHSGSTFERKVLRTVVRLAGIQRYVTFQHFRQTFCTDIVASSGN